MKLGRLVTAEMSCVMLSAILLVGRYMCLVLYLLFKFVIIFCMRTFIKAAFRNGLKQGEALSPLLFHPALEYASRSFQGNKNALKLNDTHQLLVYAADVSMLGGSVHSIKKNTEALFRSCQ
jgi:hypothetical protein